MAKPPNFNTQPTLNNPLPASEPDAFIESVKATPKSKPSDAWEQAKPVRKIQEVKRRIEMTNPGKLSCKAWEVMSHPPVRAYAMQVESFGDDAEGAAHATIAIARLIASEPAWMHGREFSSVHVADALRMPHEDVLIALQNLRIAKVVKKDQSNKWKVAHGRQGALRKVRSSAPLSDEESMAWSALQHSIEMLNRSAILSDLENLAKAVRRAS